MTTKEFRELKERVWEAKGNIRFTNKLLESLTEKQLQNLLEFYISNFKIDNDLKNGNVDLLEDAIMATILEEKEEQEVIEPKKVALEKKKKFTNKKSEKDAKNEGKIVIDINKLKIKDKLIVIDSQDNYSIIEIRDIEPAYGILGRDVNDLSNCFSISAKELAQGFYVYNKKQYIINFYRGWSFSSPF